MKRAVDAVPANSGKKACGGGPRSVKIARAKADAISAALQIRQGLSVFSAAIEACAGDEAGCAQLQSELDQLCAMASETAGAASVQARHASQAGACASEGCENMLEVFRPAVAQPDRALRLWGETRTCAACSTMYCTDCLIKCAGAPPAPECLDQICRTCKKEADNHEWIDCGSCSKVHCKDCFDQIEVCPTCYECWQEGGADYECCSNVRIYGDNCENCF